MDVRRLATLPAVEMEPVWADAHHRRHRTSLRHETIRSTSKS
jgi:hypothetical protein